MEFNAIANFFDSDSFSSKQKQWGLGVDYIRKLGRNEYFAPYAVAGGGYIKSRNDNPLSQDGSGFMSSLGIGMLTPLNVFDMDLRIELRLRNDNSVSSRQDYLLSLGLQRTVNPQPTPFPDRDSDGIADATDLCRKTPRDMAVDLDGCARIQDKDVDPNDLFDDGWYVTGMVSYIDDADDRNVDDGFAGYHIGLGRGLTGSSSFELNAIANFFNADGPDSAGTDNDQYQLGLGVDYIHKFGNNEYFVPYAVVGAGFIKSQYDNPSQKDSNVGTMTSLGVGMLTPLKLFDMMLRTELRLRTDFSDGRRQDYLLSIGLQRVLKPRPVSLTDSDFDGIGDPMDRCGSTPRDTVVDRYGCARMRDNDRDGIPDEKDMCGGSPPNSEVDESGCVRSEERN